MRDVIIDAIQTLRPDQVLDRYLFHKTPYVFGDDRNGYLRWKHELASRLQVDVNEIVFVGSGAVGVSLNPEKNLTSFSGTSDIDIAIISNYYFGLAWRFLRAPGSLRSRLGPRELAAFDKHRTNYIYWGTIATDKILQFLPFGAQWMDHIAALQRVDPTRGRTINFRIYNDFDSLRSYQRVGVNKIRDRLLTPDYFYA
jgi:hypothetical protein